jgi:hypothetical protein
VASASNAFPESHCRSLVLAGPCPSNDRLSDTLIDRWPAADRWAASGAGAVTVGQRVYVPGGGTQPGLGESDALEAFRP